jgi:hypothetical protein
VYERYGDFNLEMGTAADYELMLRFLVKRRITAAYLPEILIQMRSGGDSPHFSQESAANPESTMSTALQHRKHSRHTYSMSASVFGTAPCIHSTLRLLATTLAINVGLQCHPAGQAAGKSDGQEGLGGERVEALSLDLDDEAATEGGAMGFTTATADAVSLSSYKDYQVHQVTKWHCR